MKATQLFIGYTLLDICKDFMGKIYWLSAGVTNPHAPLIYVNVTDTDVSK